MGKKTSKTTSSSQPWAPAQPILTDAGNAILNNYNQNQGTLNSLENTLTGSIIPGLAQKAGDTSMLKPGTDYINGVLNPNYLKTGQAQAQALGNYAGQQAGNAINSTFSLAGRTGSDNHATDLARGVTQAELAPMLQNLQYNQGLQQQAAGMLPSMYASQFSGYTPLIGAAQTASQIPYAGANSLGNIGGLFGGYGTSTNTQPGGWGTALLGGLSNMFSFAPISLSDRRLKMNIVRLGDWDDRGDGLGKFEWNWKADPNGPKVTGVIADEVRELRPQAYVPNYHNGYDGVNYAVLGAA